MKQAIQISFDELGHIFIPASMRESLRLSPGMTLIVETWEQGGALLRVKQEPSALVEKDGMLVARVTAISALSDVTRHERDRRVFDLLQRVGL
jgi:bifunctional DNA-binding transcriptional regulator/antitoxin component of YhaV-PrlF toxin-antitoxin module